MLQDTALSQGHVLLSGIIADHSDDNATGCDNITRTRALVRAFSDQSLGFARVTVIYPQLVACLEEIAGHWLSHVSKTDEANTFVHFFHS